MKDDQKKDVLNQVVNSIEKQYGKGSIMKFDGSNSSDTVEVIPTGSLLLDELIGIGGVARGRIVEIYGHEGSGKTTIALSIIAQAQKQGGNFCFIDAEHALDVNFAQTLGVQFSDDSVVSQPEYGEQALEIIDQLVRSGAVDVIVVDSVAALVPKSELEGDMGDSHMGLQARLMSQALRKITGPIAKSNTLVIFINQIRSKIGVMFGNPETTTGGNALKFYASLRLETRKKSLIKKKDVLIGHEIEVKVVKNKLSVPYKSGIIELIYGKGFNKTAEIVDIATQRGILTKAGSWYSFEGKNIAQGKDALVDLLDRDPNLYQILFNLVTTKAA